MKTFKTVLITLVSAYAVLITVDAYFVSEELKRTTEHVYHLKNANRYLKVVVDSRGKKIDELHKAHDLHHKGE